MPRAVVISYSQTGQLDRILDALLAPLCADASWQVVRVRVQPADPPPFPWPFLRFFDTFPETVAGIAPPLAPTDIPEDADLVILGYPVWFLAPAQPITAFLDLPNAQRLLRGRRVMTVTGCRNMWLMAHAAMRARLAALGARHVDHVALTDQAHAAATFISTPWWMLTGNRGPLLGGLIPRAGVPDTAIAACARFGETLRTAWPNRAADDDRPFLAGCGAVRINPHLIASERVGQHSFRIWSRLLRRIGPPGQPLRRCVLVLYILFLLTLICTVVPITAVAKRLLAPFQRRRIAAQVATLAAPSGV
jgi:hypothetical protein